MGNLTRGHHIECRTCTAVIGVSALLPEEQRATKHDITIERESLDELLVDYGWLPTSKGAYCPQHAAQARATFRHYGMTRRSFN
jgi:hypothetical protein